jgi:hypothetical protein
MSAFQNRARMRLCAAALLCLPLFAGGARAQMATLREVAGSDQPRTLPAGSRGFVDINSIVEITPDRAQILARYARSAQNDPALARITAISDTLQQVTELLGTMKTNLQQASEGIRAAAAVLQTRPDDPAGLAQLNTALRSHAATMNPLIRFLRARGLNTSAALNASDPGYVAIGELAKGEIERIGQHLAEAVAEFNRSRPDHVPRVQVYAVRSGPGGPSTQLHVSNYDNLPAGDVTPVDKLAFAMTPAEQARIEQSQNLARGVIDLAGDVRTAAASLSADAASVGRLVRAEMDSVGAVLDSLPTGETLRELSKEFAALPQADRLRADLEAVANVVDGLASLRSLHATAMQKAQISSSPATLLSQLGETRQAVNAVVAQLGTLPQLQANLLKDVTDLRAAAGELLQNAAGQQRTRLETLLQEQIPRWERNRQNLTGIAAHYNGVVVRVNQIAAIVNAAAGAQRVGSVELPLAQIENTLLALRADALQPGELYLGRAVADGDEVKVTVRVLDPNGAEVAREERRLGVRTYGWFRNWTAGLAFARTGGETGFKPGVSTSYVLHYRSRPHSKGSLLDPSALGVGLSSVIFTRDNGIQLGAGLTLTLLNDLIQTGYGINLQTEKGYVMVATPLLDLINRARGAVAP